jgi:hypothetical protein
MVKKRPEVSERGVFIDLYQYLEWYVAGQSDQDPQGCAMGGLE